MKKPDIKWEHSIELDEKTIDSLEYVWELLELIPGVRVTKWPSKSEQCRVSIWFDDKEFQKVQSRGAGRKKRRTTEKYERFAEMLREKKTKQEIMTELGISDATYYRYKKEATQLPVIHKKINRK